MWKLFQLTVFFAVYFTGIHYEWTPNGYVLGLLSVGAAFFATLLLSGAFDLCLTLFGKKGDQGGTSRWRKIAQRLR